jgi:tetratricopeptide (TPR) repeat protein
VCLAIAEKLGDGALRVGAHEAAGRSAALRGDYPRAIEHFLTVLSLYDPDKHIMRLYMGGLDWSSLATGFIGMAKLRLGYPDQAQKWCSDALALARQRGIAMTVAWTWLYETYVRLGRRDIEESLQAIEAWRAASIEAGVLGFWNPWFELGEGWCQCQRGDAEEAIRLTKAGLDGMLRQGLNIIIPYWTAWVGQALALGGRAEEGLRLLDEARARSTATDEMFVEADTLRIRGDLLLAQREPRVAEAEATYREAIALARTQTTKWFELRATVSLARLLRTRGRSDEARGMLREIHGWFTEGFETQDLKEAAALLAELEEGRSATA